MTPNEVQSQIQSRISSSNLVELQVWNRVRRLVWGQVRDQVEDQVRDQAKNQLGSDWEELTRG